MVRADAQERAQLPPQDFGICQQQANASRGQRGVARDREGEIGELLVAADVQQAKDNPTRVERVPLHA